MKKLLPRAEMLCLALLAVAIMLELFEVKVAILYIISLCGLALVFFFFAQTPENEEKSENRGFKELLGLTILPRILWIGTAVSTVGILFHLQRYAGAEKLLLIGGGVIIVCTLILLVLRFLDIMGLEKVFPILYRSYPAALIAAYFVFS